MFLLLFLLLLPFFPLCVTHYTLTLTRPFFSLSLFLFLRVDFENTFFFGPKNPDDTRGCDRAQQKCNNDMCLPIFPLHGPLLHSLYTGVVKFRSAPKCPSRLSNTVITSAFVYRMCTGLIGTVSDRLDIATEFSMFKHIIIYLELFKT